MKHEIIFNYRSIFLCTCLAGVVYCKIVLPYISIDEEKERIIKIPTEFSGLYITDTFSTSAISFPLIPTFS
ncbi:MAG: hypothetical protein COX89_01105 [Candidatus Nealsonbacteria bacterium CG_4_10_14_0_2_um_filter_37_10]|uniref:Uncharacterized protein n=3 Tax=Candidatus Nealsoniibacteriota TaxID=1817911 RepID=A0A2M7UZZ0_9BACT|nr:MAG: hypothetical protein COU43_01125 [Candidatus Nealsonbacteria bacterium CG10_big_fil_rev_8_21_14_0_10_37_25]PIZ89527.1 MAG: hypothetical protein COX89_01105 [Candidatus Nealsonbacteria bacterium CG_4_10_14_0_2_um_filter_37_10]PJA84114.1 MAG: hypothetical protein CO145_02315 [Candidatus Nealsonbacteria bacterium CG_4_9_14_3_um_filter_37_13]